MAKRHVHKYHRVEIGYHKVFACALPDCNHFMPHNLSALVEGKHTICWECDKEMVMDSDAMDMDKPVCFNCRHPEISDSGADNVMEFLKG